VLIFGFKGTNRGNADYASVEHRKPRVPEAVAIMVSHFMLELPARAGEHDGNRGHGRLRDYAVR
jgi:hypothetical protein